jgi:hypothetical protein
MSNLALINAEAVHQGEISLAFSLLRCHLELRVSSLPIETQS